MADPIREALKRLLAVIKPKYTDLDEIVAVVRAMVAAHTALAAEPPAPDPREALAARPLLEAVARLGDCIGQHTVGEIKTISDRAAAWLRENPPGQPAAIEPRGCPTPGACSCVEPPAPAEPDTDAVPTLAAIIRESAGNGLPGAARLAELILSHPKVASVFQPPAPAPAADGEREELAQWLEGEANDYDDFYPPESSLKLYRAAALLRQLPPEGLEAIRYWAGDDDAVIQRTTREPESWAIRAGSSCMSTTGEWDIEPMPSDRTDEWLTNHRWPSAAAAWAALQQARRQEVGDE